MKSESSSQDQCVRFLVEGGREGLQKAWLTTNKGRGQGEQRQQEEGVLSGVLPQEVAAGLSPQGAH